MIHSRIREIRKEKGLTLQDVAERAGTTAQTIGRLETGMRTLSIKWVNRISKALETDASELLALPQQGDIEISGLVAKDGLVSKKAFGAASVRFSAKSPIALKIRTNLGEYRAGDTLVCEGGPTTGNKQAVGRDCLVELKGGKRLLAKVVAGSKKDTFTLIPIGNAGTMLQDKKLKLAAPVVNLLRTFKT